MERYIDHHDEFEDAKHEDLEQQRAGSLRMGQRILVESTRAAKKGYSCNQYLAYGIDVSSPIIENQARCLLEL